MLPPDNPEKCEIEIYGELVNAKPRTVISGQELGETEQLPGIVVKRSLKSTSINDPDTFGKIPEPVDAVSLVPIINVSTCTWQLSKFSLVLSNRKRDISPGHVTFSDVSKNSVMEYPEQEASIKLDNCPTEGKTKRNRLLFLGCCRKKNKQ